MALEEIFQEIQKDAYDIEIALGKGFILEISKKTDSTMACLCVDHDGTRYEVMLPYMPPNAGEEPIKALEDFAGKLTKDIKNIYATKLNEALESERKHVDEFYRACQGLAGLMQGSLKRVALVKTLGPIIMSKVSNGMFKPEEASEVLEYLSEETIGWSTAALYAYISAESISRGVQELKRKDDPRADRIAELASFYEMVRTKSQEKEKQFEEFLKNALSAFGLIFNTPSGHIEELKDKIKNILI